MPCLREGASEKLNMNNTMQWMNNAEDGMWAVLRRHLIKRAAGAANGSCGLWKVFSDHSDQHHCGTGRERRIIVEKLIIYLLYYCHTFTLLSASRALRQSPKKRANGARK